MADELNLPLAEPYELCIAECQRQRALQVAVCYESYEACKKDCVAPVVCDTELAGCMSEAESQYNACQLGCMMIDDAYHIIVP